MLDYKIYLKEILLMIEKIENSILGKTVDNFVNDVNLFDATLMRLHFIGETIKSIPFSLKKDYDKVKWRKFARLRNIISHRYSNVNKNLIWDVVNQLPELKNKIKEILDDESNLSQK